MKKALIALAVLGLTGGAAVAQSSVTLFGVVDANLRYTKASGLTLKRVDSGGLSTSRFGVRGVEDLGGGLKAGFWLESQVNADNGTVDATRFWGRRATVSLMGDFGEVRLGRYKTATKLHIEDFDPYSATGLGDVTTIFGNALGTGAATFSRADNMVSYETPKNLGGVYAAADISAGEGVNANKMQDFRVGYKQGPLHVSAAVSSTSTATKYKVASFGGSYDLGVAKPALMYTTTKAGSAELKAWMAAVTVPLGQGQILASYTDSKANSAAEKIAGVGDARLFAIGYVYSLSKRTALYTTAAQIKNNGLGRYALAGSPNVVAGAKSSGLDVGLRHSF